MKRPKKDLRDADMSAYGQFAWQDALSLATWLTKSFDLEAIRESYEATSVQDNHEFEIANAEIIQELLARPEGQRSAYLRRVSKNVSSSTQGMLIVMAIIAQVRVMEVIELRDRFRYSLSPGGGTRITCANIYAFNNAMMDVSFMAWPAAVFEAASAKESERMSQWAIIEPFIDEFSKALERSKKGG